MEKLDLRIPRTAAAPRERAKRMVPKGDQCRCHCGSLLARMVSDGLELKCRRCKSLVLITHEELIEMYKQLDDGTRVPGKTIRF